MKRRSDQVARKRRSIRSLSRNVKTGLMKRRNVRAARRRLNIRSRNVKAARMKRHSGRVARKVRLRSLAATNVPAGIMEAEAAPANAAAAAQDSP
jgi:hypothetical protein